MNMLDDSEKDKQLFYIVQELEATNFHLKSVEQSIDGLNQSINNYHKLHVDLQISAINRTTTIANLLWLVIGLLVYIAYKLS